MMTFTKMIAKPAVIAVLGALALSGCSTAERLSRVGKAPDLSPVLNPTQQRDYRPVSLPMPQAVPITQNPNSLWRTGSRAFFKDQRASQVGDVLTVLVNIQNEQAQLSNQTQRQRANAQETLNVPNLFNAQNRLLPGSTQTPALDVTSTSNFQGNGTINRGETVTVRLSAVVLQVLPNGNLAIGGRQELRVNNELRELTVAGVIRPEDISATNSVNWDRIAEARISYGGRGDLSDVQRPRYGQQIFDIVFPF